MQEVLFTEHFAQEVAAYVVRIGKEAIAAQGGFLFRVKSWFFCRGCVYASGSAQPEQAGLDKGNIYL